MLAGDARHDRVAIWLHWITALLVALLWIAGQTIDFAPRGPLRVDYRSLHIVMGASLAVVLIVRLAWRLSGKRILPPLEHGPLALAAQAMHGLLYILLATVVIIGVRYELVRGDSLFGLWSVPSIAPGDKALRESVGDWHALAANAVVIAAALHAAAALYHHFVRRDATLRRMLPWTTP